MIRDRNTTARGGPIAAFERQMANTVGTRHALAMNSGTAALHSAFFAVGVKPGDEVIVPGYTFFASIAPILQCGATPVLCDIDAQTLTADPADVEQRITDRTKAICVVHVWGNPARMDRFVELAKRYNLSLIEDCSHAHGASVQGTPVGGWGDVGCFSLQGSKPVSGGEAGVSVTNDPSLFDRMLLLGHANRADQDQAANTFVGDNMAMGVKYRPHLYAMELARASLNGLHDLNRRRRRNYQILADTLQRCEAVEPVATHQGAVRGGMLEFVLRYHPERAGGLNIGAFAKAVAAEGAPVRVDRYMRLGHRASYSGLGAVFQDIDYGPLGSYLGGPAGESAPAVHPSALPVTQQMVDRVLGMPALTKVSQRYVRRCGEAIVKVANAAPALADWRTGDSVAAAGNGAPSTA